MNIITLCDNTIMYNKVLYSLYIHIFLFYSGLVQEISYKKENQDYFMTYIRYCAHLRIIHTVCVCACACMRACVCVCDMSHLDVLIDVLAHAVFLFSMCYFTCMTVLLLPS